VNRSPLAVVHVCSTSVIAASNLGTSDSAARSFHIPDGFRRI
jgi:hypothetical protein